MLENILYLPSPSHLFLYEVLLQIVRFIFFVYFCMITGGLCLAMFFQIKSESQSQKPEFSKLILDHLYVNKGVSFLFAFVSSVSLFLLSIIIMHGAHQSFVTLNILQGLLVLFGLAMISTYHETIRVALYSEEFKGKGLGIAVMSLLALVIAIIVHFFAYSLDGFHTAMPVQSLALSKVMIFFLFTFSLTPAMIMFFVSSRENQGFNGLVPFHNLRKAMSYVSLGFILLIPLVMIWQIFSTDLNQISLSYFVYMILCLASIFGAVHALYHLCQKDTIAFEKIVFPVILLSIFFFVSAESVSFKYSVRDRVSEVKENYYHGHLNPSAASHESGTTNSHEK